MLDDEKLLRNVGVGAAAYRPRVPRGSEAKLCALVVLNFCSDAVAQNISIPVVKDGDEGHYFSEAEKLRAVRSTRDLRTLGLYPEGCLSLLNSCEKHD